MSTDPQTPGAATKIPEEDLVAYLDGELDAETSRQIEAQLATDAVARRAVQRFEQAWDALDTLPRSDLDEAFTRSTVEMVAISAASDVDELKAQTRRRRALALAGLAASALVATLAGFSAMYWQLTAPNRQLVRDLPVIENMEYYRHAESLEFLRRLEAEGLFSDEVVNAY